MCSVACTDRYIQRCKSSVYACACVCLCMDVCAFLYLCLCVRMLANRSGETQVLEEQEKCIINTAGLHKTHSICNLSNRQLHAVECEEQLNWLTTIQRNLGGSFKTIPANSFSPPKTISHPLTCN